jgi:hypothetical protein
MEGRLLPEGESEDIDMILRSTSVNLQAHNRELSIVSPEFHY